MSCTWDALPLLGYVQYLGDLPEGNMGILPFWAFNKINLPWTWTAKNCPWMTPIHLREFREGFGFVSPSGKKTFGGT
jgi:hypothetical protein